MLVIDFIIVVIVIVIRIRILTGNSMFITEYVKIKV
jgi:hypothetical protein